MKVCFIAPYAYPLFNELCSCNFGGAEVQMYFLAKSLSFDHSFQIHFITADFGQKNIEFSHNITLHKTFALKRTFQSKSPIFHINLIVKTIKFIYILLKIDADIYIQRNAGAETGLCAAVARLKRKKFIYMTAHDMDCNRNYIKDNGIKGRLFTFGLNRADCIITQTKRHNNLLQTYHALPSRILQTAYEIDSMPEEQKTFILWVGRIIHWKQPHIFIEIAKNYPYESFVMIAPQSCPENEYNEFLMKVKEVKNIQYINYIAFSKIDFYFKKAKILINTSKYEGFPNTFIQSFKNGTPVITLGVNPDNIINEYTLGFCAADIEQMKYYVNVLLKDDVYSTFSKNCFNYAKKNHDLKNIIVEFKNILLSL